MNSFIKFWKSKVKEEAPAPAEFEPAKTDDIVVLGHYAEEALKNPAFNAAFNKIEADIVNAWKTSPPKEEEAREHLYYRLEGLAYIKTKLEGMISNMKIEAKKSKNAKPETAA
jgi:hypothetical protein